MQPIIGAFTLDFWTVWRLTLVEVALMLRWLIIVASAFVGLIAADHAWPHPVAMVLESAAVIILFGAFVTSVSMIAFLVVMAIGWRTLLGAGSRRSVEICAEGITFVTTGETTMFPWEAVRDVRVFARCLLLRSDRWIAIPRVAFQPHANSGEAKSDGLNSAFVACLSFRIADKTASTERHVDLAHSEGEAPMIRVVVPPKRVRLSGLMLRLFRHRPTSALLLVVFPFLPLIAPHHVAVLVIIAVVFLPCVWAQDRARWNGQAGKPEVIELAETGVIATDARRQVRFRWTDVEVAVEERGGFFLASREGELLFLPIDCIQGGDTGALRQMLRERVGPRAKLAR